MVKNYKRGVRDGQPVEYGSLRHKDPSRVLTIAQPIKRGPTEMCSVSEREQKFLKSRGKSHYVIKYLWGQQGGQCRRSR